MNITLESILKDQGKSKASKDDKKTQLGAIKFQKTILEKKQPTAILGDTSTFKDTTTKNDIIEIKNNDDANKLDTWISPIELE